MNLAGSVSLPVALPTVALQTVALQTVSLLVASNLFMTLAW